MIKVSPSILSADILNLSNTIDKINNSNADSIHLDVMDGSFVPEITFGANVVRAVKKASSKSLDVHLMIDRPMESVDSFINCGSDMITFHHEAERHSDRLVGKIKENNILAGIALNPSTPIVSVKHLIDKLDLLLIMGVNPGYGGQSFINYTLDKIKEAKDLSKNKNLIISVDGGVNSSNLHSIINAGANYVVLGSYLVNAQDSEYNDIIKGIQSIK